MRKKILITGGFGTIGSALINNYDDEFDFVNICRSGIINQDDTKAFENIKNYKCDILNSSKLLEIFEIEKPDIVVHTAAVKHVNVAEENPSMAVETNLVGSLNVIRASINSKVAVTIGISTDKASQPENVYGYTKKMMEQMFIEHHTKETKFVCVRLANVAGSNGSVIPYWVNLAKEGQDLGLTDSRMNRLMLSKKESAELIHKAFRYASNSEKAFTITKVLKAVNMAGLAKSIANYFGKGSKIKLIGLRPGEKLNETLISENELAHSYITQNHKYILLYNDEFGKERLQRPLSSLTADLMSATEIEELYT